MVNYILLDILFWVFVLYIVPGVLNLLYVFLMSWWCDRNQKNDFFMYEGIDVTQSILILSFVPVINIFMFLGFLFNFLWVIIVTGKEHFFNPKNN